jgi:hypothetical protein
MLVLLALMAGNPSFGAVDEAAMDDVEAVAEWRIDADAVDAELGADPELPAALLFSSALRVAVAERFAATRGHCCARKSGLFIRSSRAPPAAALA